MKYFSITILFIVSMLFAQNSLGGIPYSFNSDIIENKLKKYFLMFEEIEYPKWTAATYIPYIYKPDTYMFIKPDNTNEAAEICGWNIQYQSKPNWNTYKHVLELSNYIFDQLSDLKPRDMIDIQSFFWVIQPNYK